MTGEAEENQPTTPEDPNDSTAAADAVDSPAEQIVNLRRECEESRERYLRLAAELDNVRKRASRDLENARKFGIERFAASLLPVVDSLEAGIAAENIELDTLRAGQQATLRLLEEAFANAGVAQIDPRGEPFDPNLHEAMSLLEAAHAEPDSVVDVVQKGYVIEGRLLRPARVIVARNPTEDS